MAVTNLDPATDCFCALIEAVPADDLGRPTPCTEYSVGDLLDHIRGVTVAWSGAAVKSSGDSSTMGPSGDSSNLEPAWRTSLPRAALEEELFGKHVLITDHDDWPVAEVVTGYRSQSEAEFAFRQLKDPHVVSFSPMHHWTEHNIRVHTFTCVLALQIAHLMRHRARQARLHLSVPALLGELAGIAETVLLYQGDRGRPKARRMLTETNPTQDTLTQLFHLDRYAPS